ncbi:MAG: phage major capsid protein [Lachnospiraceae bacterium]|jgi:HK97 family phage major capsid protein|nr:phage major capsid protein [Lachnospiraceae bacterium]
MNKKQYEAMRRKLMAEAQAFIDAGDAEQAQAKIDEVTALDQKWDAIAQAAANFNALNTEPQTKNPIINMEGELDTGEKPKNKDILEMWESKEYLNAWGKQLQGKPLDNAESETYRLVNEAYTHTTKNTGIVIPKSVAGKIWELAGEMYPYFEDVQKTYVNGILSVPMEDTSSDAAWYEEATKTEDGKEKFKEFLLSGCELARTITVSWKLKEMAMDDFIPYIQRKMAKKMGAAAGYGATHGKGTAVAGKPEPVGVVTALEKESNTPQIITYKGAPEFADMTAARALIKSGYSAGLRIYANSATIWNKIANIVDANKRPIFMSDPTTGGYRVLGMEVKEDDSMLDGEILISNAFAGYHANINKEMTMMSEDHVKDRETDYCGYAIMDGNVITNKAHALLKEVAQTESNPTA